MYELRATRLEKYNRCPYNFKFGRDVYGGKEALIFGTKTHKYIQTFLKNNEDPALSLIVADLGMVQRKKIHRMALLVKGYIADKGYAYVMDEYSIQYEHNDSLYLEGTFDILVTDKEGRYILLDLKTAKSERTDAQIEISLQRQIYPFLFTKVTNIPIYAFEYVVLTKHSIPRMQIVPHELPTDNNEQVIDVVESYINSEETNTRPAKANFGCVFCSLKKEGKCPLYSKTPF